MPPSRQKHGALRDSCPDSESLCAFAEGRAHGVVRDAIAAHLTGCSECTEAHSRLLSFASEAVPTDDREWRQAEKRLDNWAEGIFRGRRATPDSTTPRQSMGRNWWLSWQLPWAISAVSALALLVSTVVFLKFEQAERRLAQFPNAQTQVAPSAQSRSEESIPQALPKPENAVPTQGPAGNSISNKGISNPPKPTRKAAPRPAGNAPSSEGESASSGGPTNAPAPPQPSEPPPSSASAQNNSPDVVAPARTTSNAHQATLRAPLGGSRLPVQVPGPAASITSVSRPVANLPLSFQLDAGTRIWIKLSSLTRESDGRLRFRGTLFEPVTVASKVLLDRGTAVDGFETVIQGRTSLVLTDLVFQGTHYKLKSPAGKAVARSPGAGVAINFDANQIVETFLEVASVYEKTPGADR